MYSKDLDRSPGIEESGSANGAVSPRPTRWNGLDPPDPWVWLGLQADEAGVEFGGSSLPDAADCAVAHLERQVEAGLEPTPEAVHLAALLVRLAGEWVVSGAASARPFIERAFFRDLADRLADHYQAGLGSRAPNRTPTRIAQPQPPPKPATEDRAAIYDLLFRLNSILENLVRLHPRNEAAASE